MCIRIASQLARLAPIGAVLALAGGTANAQTNALTFFNPQTTRAPLTATFGYAFNITAAVTVTHLSVWDSNINGLAQSHEVGIWNSGGGLLASAIVGSGTSATLLGEFRLVDIPDFVLPVGTDYTVGAFMSVQGDDIAMNWTSSATAPGVTFLQGRFGTANGPNGPIDMLSRPTDTFAGVTNGLVGGSFVVAAVNNVNAPEPGSLALLGVGFAGMVGMIAVRRKRGTSVSGGISNTAGGENSYAP